MKTRLVEVILFSIAIQIPAQTVVSATATNQVGATNAQSNSYTVVQRDANSCIWERTTYEQGQSGEVLPHIHRITELATGLNFTNSQTGQWMPSKEEIDILPNGGAQAINGRHQVYFPADIYQGVIDLFTPDGKHLKSRPLGLSYFDGTNSVLIAALTNSIGQLVGSNQVLYPNAFPEVGADLRFTYTKAGLEQDVIIKAQPASPEAFALNASSSRLQLLTEFFDTADPTQVATQTGSNVLNDTELVFGAMRMGHGKAFAIDDTSTNSNSSPVTQHSSLASVAKSWQHIDGRAFLVEELPYQRVSPQLQKLPAPGGNVAASSGNSPLRKISKTRLLPPMRLAEANKSKIQNRKAKITRLAKAGQKPGVMLDYVIINPDDRAVFQADTTYYVSGNCYYNRDVTLEGGTVVKYAANATLSFNGNLICQTSAYRPCVMTAKDDNTVGETIADSTGTPSGYYATEAISLWSSTLPLHDLRVEYAALGVSDEAYGASVNDCQFINCSSAIHYYGNSETMSINNVLFDNIGGNVLDLDYSGPVNATFLTVHNVGTFAYNPDGALVSVEDSLFVRTANIGNSVVNIGPNAYLSSDAGIFQTAGGGAFYLADNSPYRNAGTASVYQGALADIAAKTTRPPVVYADRVISSESFNSQVQRDTDTPDLGYHYPPLDYIFRNCQVSGQATFPAGTAVGWQGQGLTFSSSYALNLNGLVTSPCYFVCCNTVQESDSIGDGIGISDSSGSDWPHVTATFTRFSALGVSSVFPDANSLNVELNNCEFWGGFLGYGNSEVGLNLDCYNCLFDRTVIHFPVTGNGGLIFRNCTQRGGSLLIRQLNYPPAGNVTITDSAFDGTDIEDDDYYTGGFYLSANNNAYLTGASILANDNNDVFVSSFYWQRSFFGNFYLLSNSPLFNADHGITANQVGLYHFTTQTSQAKEANSYLDIGYHYVATSSSTSAILADANGDGIPDYLEDSNGNGIYDSGDLGDWQTSINALTTSSPLDVFTPLKN